MGALTHFEGPLTPDSPPLTPLLTPTHHVAVRKNYPAAAGKIRKSSAAHRGAIDDTVAAPIAFRGRLFTQRLIYDFHSQIIRQEVRKKKNWGVEGVRKCS